MFAVGKSIFLPIPFPVTTLPVIPKGRFKYLFALCMSPVVIAFLILVELTFTDSISLASIFSTSKPYVKPQLIKLSTVASLFLPKRWSYPIIKYFTERDFTIISLTNSFAVILEKDLEKGCITKVPIFSLLSK